MVSNNQADSYRELIKLVDFRDIYLMGLNLDRIDEEVKGILTYDLAPEFKLIRKTRKELIASAGFSLTGVRKTGKKTQEILNLNARFELSYVLSQEYDITDEIADRFINNNVPVNSWPYFRELISTMTTKIGYPTLVIGPLKTVR